MKCPQCNKQEFTKKTIRFTPEVKNEIVEVLSKATVCKNCEHPIMNTAQMSLLRKLATDEYRRKHALLTSSEIVNFRESLGMSQVEFAKYLNVGEASIKRWETSFVQDPVSDQHIKLKCDVAYAERNALAVSWKNEKPDIYSGNRKFNFEHFKSLVLCLVEKAKSPLYLNKALFYADFKHFEKYGRSITGSRYVPLDHGPCPDQYRKLFGLLIDNGILKTTKNSHELKRTVTPNIDLFDDQEKETITHIFDMIKNDGGKHLFDVSHKEPAFNETQPFAFISYKYANQLKLKK